MAEEEDMVVVGGVGVGISWRVGERMMGLYEVRRRGGSLSEVASSSGRFWEGTNEN